MKKIILFLMVSFSVASQIFAMELVTAQDFDRMFIHGDGAGLSSSPVELNRRCIEGSVGNLRGTHLLYPLEHALYRWLVREKRGDMGGNRTYTPQLVIAWITKLLASKAPCRYTGFNPLVCLLYWYDKGAVSRQVLKELVPLLCQYGADPCDTTEDRYVVGSSSRSPSNNSRLEAFINNKKTVSVLDILNNIPNSECLTGDDITSTRELVVSTLAAKSKPGESTTPVLPTPQPINPITPVLPTVHTPRLFTARHVALVGFVSFVCGIGAKYLYDWYVGQNSEDDTQNEQHKEVV